MFYIKEVIVYTTESISTVKLEPGLNIVCGESNTGKTMIYDCINYVFNASESDFDKTLGITEIALVLDVEGEDVTLKRAIDSKKITVSSMFKGIRSGEYKTGNAQNGINIVLMQLLGIDDSVKILSTLAGKTQRMTFRSIIHNMLVDEIRVQNKGTVLTSGRGFNNKIKTSDQTALLYMATERDYLPSDDVIDPKLRSARKEAVHKFFDRSMKELADTRISEVEANLKMDPIDIQNKINMLLDEISGAKDELSHALSESDELGQKLVQIDSDISECKVLKNRNEKLFEQYRSDIQRLTFIAEGDVYNQATEHLLKCPFCSGELTKSQSTSCLEAAAEEVRNIERQVADLASVQESLAVEQASLEDSKREALQRRDALDIKIRGEIKPKIAELRTKLEEYTVALNQHKAKEMIEKFSNVLVSQMNISDEEDEKEFSFNAKEKMREVFAEDLNGRIKTLLEECGYNNHELAYFDIDNCDITVGGHEKHTQGKGYRAFLNTIMAIAMHEFLKENGMHRFPILVIDSPIMSLKEREDSQGDEYATDTMKSSLFKYLVAHQYDEQRIILENRIPEIDYRDVNIIKFTKDKNNEAERYGLITGYVE